MCSRSGVAFVLAVEMSGVLGCAPRGVAGRSGIRVATDVVYARRDGQDLLADVHSPASGGGPFPGVLVVHGGSWQRGICFGCCAGAGISRPGGCRHFAANVLAPGQISIDS